MNILKKQISDNFDYLEFQDEESFNNIKYISNTKNKQSKKSMS